MEKVTDIDLPVISIKRKFNQLVWNFEMRIQQESMIYLDYHFQFWQNMFGSI